jgi:hypothetical protein
LKRLQVYRATSARTREQRASIWRRFAADLKSKGESRLRLKTGLSGEVRRNDPSRNPDTKLPLAHISTLRL